MHVILSSTSDDCAAKLYGELRSRGFEVVLVDETLSAADFAIRWCSSEFDAADWVQFSDTRINLGEIDGILLRQLNALRPNPQQAHHDQQFVSYEMYAVIEGLLSGIDAPVVNRPRPGHGGRHFYSRRHALRLLHESGLLSVDTWLSTAPINQQVMKESTNSLKCQLTPLHGGASPTLLPMEQLAEHFEQSSTAHSQSRHLVQRIPEGTRAQIYVTGDRAVAVQGPPASLQSGLDPELAAPLSLPAKVVSGAVELAAALELLFAQVDIVLGDADQAHCIAVHEHPVFTQCASTPQREIVSGLADLMSRERSYA